MTLKDVKEILNAEVLFGKDYMLGCDVEAAFASDFMSDVLAYVTNQEILLTGMVNPQVIRTAQMMDMKCIVFLRGKKPDEDILKLAEKNGIVVMKTEEILYRACGMLYKAGLKG